MKSFAIAKVSLVRYLRDRSAIFTMFILPMLIVLLLGAMSGGAATPQLGFVAEGEDPLVVQLRNSLLTIEGVEVVEMEDVDSAIRGVERGELQAALIVPIDYESTLRAGDDAEIRYVAQAGQEDQTITRAVTATLTREATLLRAARFSENAGVGTFDQALGMAEELQSEIPPVEVVATTAGEPFALGNLGQFDIYAQGMLVLFIFMTTIAGATNLVQTRTLGVARRMYSTPTPVSTMLGGEALGRMTIALIQGLFIFVGTWLIFGVDWGNPLAAGMTILVFAAVATAAAMLLGSLVGNDQQAGGIATALGLGLAALGGCMFPLAVFEILSDTVYRVAHVTPHAWAMESFFTLVAEDGGLGDIAGFLLILLGYAAVLFGLATWRLRKVLVR
jgi:ABC-2 type transport system permease protein